MSTVVTVCTMCVRVRVQSLSVYACGVRAFLASLTFELNTVERSLLLICEYKVVAYSTGSMYVLRRRIYINYTVGHKIN